MLSKCKLILVLGALTLVSGTAAAQNFDAPLAEAEGEVTALSFGTNSMIVGGYSYQVSETAEVSINGSYGAFTMLETGMLIEFEYLRFDDGVRRITRINQVSGVEEY